MKKVSWNKTLDCDVKLQPPSVVISANQSQSKSPESLIALRFGSKKSQKTQIQSIEIGSWTYRASCVSLMRFVHPVFLLACFFINALHVKIARWVYILLKIVQGQKMGNVGEQTEWGLACKFL